MRRALIFSVGFVDSSCHLIKSLENYPEIQRPVDGAEHYLCRVWVARIGLLGLSESQWGGDRCCFGSSTNNHSYTNSTHTAPKN